MGLQKKRSIKKTEDKTKTLYTNKLTAKNSKATKQKKGSDIKIHLKKNKNFKSIIDFIKRDLKHLKQSKMPADLKPMLASITEESFNDENWQFEIKWDGYRCLAYLNKAETELRSRNNLSFNAKYFPVYNELKRWGINAVVDGEIVVLDEEGKVDFNGLQQWHKTNIGNLYYYVFDLLWLDGFDLTNEPLYKRRDILKQLIPEGGLIRYSESIDEFGVDFFAVAKKNGLEGIIAKRKDAVYQPGFRTKNWYKVKAEQRHEAIICGYTKNKDSDRLFSALVLGIYQKGALNFIGLVGTGFSVAAQKEIINKIKPLKIKSSPFGNTPNTGAQTFWVQPQIVCEVKYTELTKEGVMRHPSFQGIREDKSVDDLNDETYFDEKTAEDIITESDDLINEDESEKIVSINNHDLKLTNLQKIYWPKEKITKGDLLNYYYNVAEYLMPYMKDRPQSLNRFPNGINGQSFYQKDMGGKVDKWLKTFSRLSESVGEYKDFLICTDTASLIYMANLGCIEMNPWHSRVQSPHHPDWSVIDLDPGDISFEKVIETVLVVKSVLDAMEVPSFPKTSGSTGIHIYVPLGAKYNYEQSKQFAELVANIVHDQIPDFTSIERNPAKRKDKIYIDYLQNRPIQTICAPYSVRPKRGATVSTPLHWSEVKKGLQISNFTIHNIFDRLRNEGDLFTGVLGKGIDLNAVLKKLTSLI